MKFVLKSVLALAIMGAFWSMLLAAPPPAVRQATSPAPRVNIDASVRAAIALANARQSVAKPSAKPAPKAACPCGCSCTDCLCATGQPCGDPGCICAAKKGLSLSAALEKAVAYDRPLLIWVREVCPPCEAQMSEYIHVHVEQYQGANDLVDYPAVIVGKPDGQGGITRVATFSGIPSKEQVSEALNPRPRMIYLPPPPMMMSFGGCSS